MPKTPNTGPPTSPPEYLHPVGERNPDRQVWLITRVRFKPVMGGMQMMPLEFVCLMRRRETAAQKIQWLDANREGDHYGQAVTQPWYGKTPFDTSHMVMN